MRRVVRSRRSCEQARPPGGCDDRTTQAGAPMTAVVDEHISRCYAKAVESRVSPLRDRSFAIAPFGRLPAGPTRSLAAVDVRIRRVIWMALRTVSLCPLFVAKGTAAHVLAVRDRLKVRWAHARGVAAPMVKLQAIEHGTVERFPRPFVCVHKLAFHAELP